MGKIIYVLIKPRKYNIIKNNVQEQLILSEISFLGTNIYQLDT